MANLDLYKTPSNEILRHRKEFYGLWKRCDDHSTTWLNRVQSQISLCEFPPILSREYLLIDKFVCELDDDERAFIQSIGTWTLMELKDIIDQQMSPLSSKTVVMECEFDGYEYSKNIANIELADETNSFAVIKSEPNALTDDDYSSTASFSDDNEVGYESIELDSDTINEILVNDMECEVEDYKFSISDATSVAETDSTNGKFSVHPVKGKSSKQNKNKHHQNEHKRKKSYVCNERNEKVVHQGVRTHIRCQKCDEYFAASIDFNRHSCKHSAVKPFACGQCAKSFVSAYSLEVHRRIADHRSISPCICDICDKTFSCYTLIRRHMIRHTGKRPYQCDQCDRSFARISYMKIHKQRIHQRFRSHACQECDKCFINSYELKQHIRKHTGEKPFVCDQCDKRFISAQNLRGHMLRIHK